MAEKTKKSPLKLNVHHHKLRQSPNQCEWHGCTEDGQHRAPRSRNELDTFRWFCREHIREYNNKWNYFAGMSDEEVEADRRADTVWRRPSWPLGNRPPSLEDAASLLRGRYNDPFFIFETSAKQNKAGKDPRDETVSEELKLALDIFKMHTLSSIPDVKARYKNLAKRYHPDSAEGNIDEERIKEINHAYKVILSFLEL